MNCDEFFNEQNINPKTGRSISIGGPTWKILMSECICNSRKTKQIQEASEKKLPATYYIKDGIIFKKDGVSIGYVGQNGEYYFRRSKR